MTVPGWFTSRLKETDPTLVVYFNPHRERWVIDRKAENGQASNVMIVQSEDGEFMPLSDNTIDRIRSMDAWTKHGSYEAYHRFNIQQEVEAQEKARKAIADGFKECTADNRRQMSEAYSLIKTHNLS